MNGKRIYFYLLPTRFEKEKLSFIYTINRRRHLLTLHYNTFSQ